MQTRNSSAELSISLGPRRTPVQKRSRERVERMLAMAIELIAEKGSDALRMGEVAERSGVSIGSLYQFFPDKTALLGTLVERCNAESRRCIEEAMASVRDEDGFSRAFAGLVDTYYRIFLAEPAMRDIWSGVQADKALREVQLLESRRNGALVAEVLKRLRPHVDPAELESSAFVVMHLGEEAMRLAISVERKEGDALVETYKRMALAELGWT
jgi:AcrR family transcriptional regulator